MQEEQVMTKESVMTKEQREAAQALIDQIAQSTSPFQTVEYVKRELEAAGFTPLSLREKWEIKPGGRYYVPAYDRTLLAFTVGQKKAARHGIRMAMAHTDSPCFKVKPAPEMTAHGCRKLNVEPYGGMIRSTWMDRPLSLAGKIALRGEVPFAPRTVLVDFQRPVLIIPNLAIHMNRKVNEGVSLDPQKDMLPLADLSGGEVREDFFLQALAAEAGCRAEDILDYEMFLYPYEKGSFVGFGETMVSCPRLDNITSVRACVQGLL